MILVATTSAANTSSQQIAQTSVQNAKSQTSNASTKASTSHTLRSIFSHNRNLFRCVFQVVAPPSW
jgi:hypothetical protein